MPGCSPNLKKALRALTKYDLLAFPGLFVHKYVTPHRQALFAAGTLCLLTYGFVAFNHTFAGDDFNVFTKIEGQNWFDWLIRIGRPVQALTYSLGGDYLAPAFTLSLMVAGLLVAGLIISVAMQLTGQLNVFIFISLLALCPVWAEHVNFKVNHLTIAVGAVSAAGAACLVWETAVALKSRHNPLHTAGCLLSASILLAIAAASKQEIYIFGLTATLLIALRHVPNASKPVSELMFAVAGTVLAAALGILIYLGLVLLTQHTFNAPPLSTGDYSLSGSLVASAEDLAMAYDRFLRYFRQFLCQGQHLIPVMVKYVFLGSLALLMATIYRKASRRSRSWKHALLVMLVSCAIAAALLILPWAIGLMRTPNSYRYNGIVAICIAFAGIITLAIEEFDSRFFKSLWQTAALLVILVFFYQNNLASSVTNHLNRRDFAIVNRILARLESDPQFEQLWRRKSWNVIYLGEPKVLSGKPFVSPMTRRPMAHSIIDCGAFDCQQQRIESLSYLLQYGKIDIHWVAVEALSAPNKDRIMKAAKEMPNWPAPGALRRVSDSEVILKF